MDKILILTLILTDKKNGQERETTYTLRGYKERNTISTEAGLDRQIKHVMNSYKGQKVEITNMILNI